MACTSLLLSSRAADAVEVPKDAAPLWRPRIIRPSFLYCSMGNQNRSLTPWTGETHGDGKKRKRELTKRLKRDKEKVQQSVWSRYKQSQLTQLDNRVHGANASQNARQLILPDVCQPLCDGILDHFVHTKEARRCCRRKTKKLITSNI